MMRHYNTRSRMGKLLYGMAAITALTGCGGGSGKSPATIASGISNTGGMTTSTSAATAFLSPAEFVYTSNAGDNTLSQFQIAKNGVLVPLTTPVVATGKAPDTIVTASNGHFLYVANTGDQTISQYQVASSGLLTPLTPATVSAGTGGSASASAIDTSFTIVVDSASRFLYAFNSSDKSLRVFAINPNGTLTFKSVVAGLASPTFIAIHPRLPALYAGNSDASLLAQFTINADGSLSPMSPATVTAPVGSESLTLTPNGKFAYMGFGDTGPGIYQVNADGSLTVIAQPVVNDSFNGAAIFCIDPGSRFVYEGDLGPSGPQIIRFNIQPDGHLAQISSSPVPAGLLEFGALFFDPSGQFLYLPETLSAALTTFRIGSDGTLSAIPTPAVGTGNIPIFAASVQRTGRKRSAMRGRNTITFVHH